MTPRQRMESVWDFRKADRVPFVPAIYEQKAFLIGSTPSRVSRDAELFYRALMVEAETYQADALVVGMDVYNLEAEAIGAKVSYYEDEGDTSIPGIRPGDHVLKFGDDLSGLKIPNPARDGRMPINLDVARRAARAGLNETVPVRGALSGPFSLALNLLGPEDFFIGMLDDPDYCTRVLEFCAETIITFGKAYLDAGVGVIMFDSQASPDLLSPQMYEEKSLPHTQRIIAALRDAGERYCPLIIGGNTTGMLEAYLQTGTRQILCDFSADWCVFAEQCTAARVSVRRNLSPHLVQKGTPGQLLDEARRYIKEATGVDGFILGTAVVPFGTPKENIFAVRQAAVETEGKW